MAHLREMRKLNAIRLDTSDLGFEGVEIVLTETATIANRTANNLELLGVKIDLLATKIDKLVDGLLRPAKNGN